MENFDGLKLCNQLCFPLYVASKEVTKRYKPFLDELGLTYTRYIAMMVVWEKREISAKELGEKLYLDSGTLTPVLKSLEDEGYVRRARSRDDERVLTVTATEKGLALREKAKYIPEKMASCLPLSPEEARTLYALLYKVIGSRNGL